MNFYSKAVTSLRLLASDALLVERMYLTLGANFTDLTKLLGDWSGDGVYGVMWKRCSGGLWFFNFYRFQVFKFSKCAENRIGQLGIDPLGLNSGLPSCLDKRPAGHYLQTELSIFDPTGLPNRTLAGNELTVAVEARYHDCIDMVSFLFLNMWKDETSVTHPLQWHWSNMFCFITTCFDEAQNYSGVVQKLICCGES